MKISHIICIAFSLIAVHSLDEAYVKWQESAREEAKKLNNIWVHSKETRPKNVILFVGDGMGMSTISAARLYLSELMKDAKSGSRKLAMEQFTFTGLLRTMSDDSIVTDSSASATALFTGIKTTNYIVGYGPNVQTNSCDDEKNAREVGKSILIQAKKRGFKTGFVTTTRVTHATPASIYGRTANRKWESISDMPKNTEKCKDLALQLREQVSYFNFIGGGGLNKFNGSFRRDGRSLIEEIAGEHLKNGRTFQFYNTTVENVNFEAEHLMMIVEPNNLSFSYTNSLNNLSMLTKHALSHLMHQADKDDSGFMLIVEGGRIDHGHHYNQAKVALDETIAFDKVISETIEGLGNKEKETLILVTADHSHGFSFIAGLRNESIFAKALGYKGDEHVKLGYLSGPGFGSSSTNEDDFLKMYPALINTTFGLHGGEDVPIFARGPSSHLFIGVHDNTYIAHTITDLISYSSRISCSVFLAFMASSFYVVF